jgi:hypothetical protein
MLTLLFLLFGLHAISSKSPWDSVTRAHFDAIFAAQRGIFAAKYPVLNKTIYNVTYEDCTLPGKCGYRDTAYAIPSTSHPIIVVSSRLASMPDENIIGVLRHEFGHLADSAWQQPGREQRADNIAEAVTGTKIRYDDKDVQTIGAGKYPRPLYLHQ